MKLLFSNSGEPDQTPHHAASDLVFHCLPMSHKRDVRLICVNQILYQATNRGRSILAKAGPPLLSRLLVLLKCLCSNKYGHRSPDCSSLPACRNK